MDLRIEQQRGIELRVTAALSGDLDEFGVDALTVAGWLGFTEIRVALADPPTSVLEAEVALRRLTDVAGLVGSRRQRVYRFQPG